MRCMVGWQMLVVALALLSPPAAEADDSYLTNIRYLYLERGRELLFNDQFGAVDSLYDSYIQAHPEDPLGYLFKAGGLMAEMSDREEAVHGDQLKALTEQVERLVDARVDSLTGRRKAWMFLLKGHARAYRALYEAHFGSFFKAVKLGLSTHSPYEQGLKADSTLYDLYLGLGSYHYWKSVKGGILRFLHILKNDKQKGIHELYLAADSSVVSRDGARSSLIWVWLNEKEYDSVISAAVSFTKKYPQGKSFLWPLSAAYAQTGRNEEALQTYLDLRQRLEADPGNYHNLIECDYAICRLLDKANQCDRLRQQAGQAAKYFAEIPKPTRKRQKDKLKRLKKWAEEK